MIVNQASAQQFFARFDRTKLYLVRIMARKKYGAAEDAVLMTELTHPQFAYEKLQNAIPAAGYFLKYGTRFEFQHCVCYFSPDPRNIEMANRKALSSWIMQPDGKLRKLVMSAAENSFVKDDPPMMDLDIDDPALLEGTEWLLKQLELVPWMKIKTRGGNRLLVSPPPSRDQAKEIRQHVQIVKRGVEIKKGAYVPIPGTLQGGAEVLLLG